MLLNRGDISLVAENAVQCFGQQHVDTPAKNLAIHGETVFALICSEYQSNALPTEMAVISRQARLSAPL